MSGVETGNVSFGGLGSGTDFGAMIDQLREVEEYHINSLEKWKLDWELRIEAFDQITNLMSDLEMQLDDMNDIYDIISLEGSSSSESTVSVVPSSSALPGTYTINIDQLATASIWSTKTATPFEKNEAKKFEPLLSTGETSSFSYSLGDGRELTYTIDDTMTIEDLVTRINNDAQNAGVKASLVSTGDGYVFQMQSTETGSKNNITINSTVPGLDSSADFNTLEAKDAIFSLNGFTDQKLTSSSNSVEGVIEGATINLKNTTGSTPETITISEDTSKIEEKVNLFVDTVNEMRSLIQELTSVDGDATAVDPSTVVTQDEADIGSILTGNYAVQLMTSRLNAIITSASPGFTTQYEKIAEIESETPKDIITATSIPENLLVDPNGYDVEYQTDANGKVHSVLIGGIAAVEDPSNPGAFKVEDITSGLYGLVVDFTDTSMLPNLSRTDKLVTEREVKHVDSTEEDHVNVDIAIRNTPDTMPNSNAGYDISYETDAFGTVHSVFIGGVEATAVPDSAGVFKVEGTGTQFDGFELSFGKDPITKNLSQTDKITVKTTVEFVQQDASSLYPTNEAKITNVPSTLPPTAEDKGYDLRYQTDASGKVNSVTIDGVVATEDPSYPGLFRVDDPDSVYHGFEVDFGTTPLDPNITKNSSVVVTNGDLESYSLISELGISTDAEEGSATYGMLVIDSVALREAIAANPRAVAELFASESTTADSENFIFHSKTDNVGAGTYDVEYETDSSGNIIPDTVYINGSKANTSEEYPNRYTAADPGNNAFGLSIEFTTGALEPNKKYTGDSVSVKQGKALELSDFFENEIRDVAGQSGNGAIPIVRSNYKEIVDNLDKKIAEEIERIDLWETRMRVRYASLDAHLGVQSAIMEANAAALAQANVSGK